MSSCHKIGYRIPLEFTETTYRGSLLSMFAIIAMSSVFVIESKAYFSSSLGANLALHRNPDDSRVQLNFNITLTDLPCNYAAVDVFSATGHQKDITKNIKKFPIDTNGVLQQYEQQLWHQNDMELWDPAIWESLDVLHEDGEDAISLNNESFHFALNNFPMVLVNFYTSDCQNCEDLAPTYEALGEIITDTAMSLVGDVHADDYSEEDYERRVNEIAPVLVTKLDCSVYTDVCDRENIKLYPSMQVYVSGYPKEDIYQGHRTVKEIVHWLSEVERKHLASDELRMQHVVKFANKRVIRSEEEEEWNDEVSHRRAPMPSSNTTLHPACQISGHLMVDEAPGKFVIHGSSYGHNFAPHMTNLSHVVHHFSFGDPDDQTFVSNSWSISQPRFQKSLHPLDENSYVTNELHQAYHHHLQVITTEIEESSIQKWARAAITRVYRIKATSHLSSYRHFIVPEAQFSYDLSPIAISYMKIQGNWYDYITGMLAIIGGTFTVIGMMDNGLSSFFPKKTYWQ